MSQSMNSENFDFGSLVNEQLKNIRRGYKFGNAFNEDKMIVRPAKARTEVSINDNATIKQALLYHNLRLHGARDM